MAEAKAVMMNSTSVSENRLMGVCIVAMVAASGCGSVSANNTKMPAIESCIATIHQRLVLMMSMNGLQNGLMTHGRYSKLVKSAI